MSGNAPPNPAEWVLVTLYGSAEGEVFIGKIYDPMPKKPFYFIVPALNQDSARRIFPPPPTWRTQGSGISRDA
ncbi:MAG TPA: hypothetical protein PKK74_03205 [Candidatus Methanoculleus thermohydrogenotrophicum]|jgi:hypothetical protein|nr:hypothetical protein [Candidatus Methanoculleus thermohydrogenotrophicum]NLM81768.1 hypothetical protein [Candidatus Methanoculleus thermohydrogenotrophicum]HOB17689.1 hypothetical protein [Candidatus Methanoculleus thermohydrogenotrophicum]HPZ37289.1 hypothetical protein [Candidatus Methanoculleus thermohydrogenotrophicum]HQC92050.1 hypothetical protein [Candidatus Methanoculleus thermohydrogenotrophicum]